MLTTQKILGPTLLRVAAAGMLASSLAGCGGDHDPAPTAEPTSTGSTTAPSADTTSTPSAAAHERVPQGEPTVPYILGGVLHVDGTTVQGGPFWQVRSGPRAWIAVDTSGHWWWGRHAEAMRIESSVDDIPTISPSGKYVGLTSLPNGITGFDTGFNGEGFGGHALDLGSRQNGTQVTVRAVTDDGLVIAQGGQTAVMWKPLVDQTLVDLTTTAPDQQVIGSTAGGLVVTDGPEDSGGRYLASIDEAGSLTKLGDLPESDSLITSPDGQSVVYSPAGTLGGEVISVRTLSAQSLDGTQKTTLQLPKGWDFEVGTWAFEDDEYVVAAVSDKHGEAMARCRVSDGACAVLRPGGAVQPASFTGRWLVQGGRLLIQDDHTARSSHASDCPAAWGAASTCTQEVRFKWTEDGDALRLLVLDVWVTDGSRKQFPDPPPPMSAGSFYTMTLHDDGSATTRLQNDDGAVTGANGLGNPALCRPGSEALAAGKCDAA